MPVTIEKALANLKINAQQPGHSSQTRSLDAPPAIPPKPHKKEQATYVNIATKKGPASRSPFAHHYSVPPKEEEEDLPPPPPPPPPSSGRVSASYLDDLPPPPSPDSSTYATQASYAPYRPTSSASSYDANSIYEPITPRPPSQMSNYSSSSLYSSYYPRAGGKEGSSQPPPGGKEAEVDHLTDLLVQSMENSADPDFYGMCYKCGEKVLGEGSGCTAMDGVYHISCFTCTICHKELQGKPFYAMDGKPFCEEDYINTLEKCCVCNKPILDRIIRATGKPYHPNCFCCILCGKCLDGIPFTVDATNQIHCIEDFNRKFAPRCYVCKQPIMPESNSGETVRVVALDRSYHINCYRCEDCGVMFNQEPDGQPCYPLDDHILCRSCNAHRVQELTSHMTTEL